LNASVYLKAEIFCRQKKVAKDISKRHSVVVSGVLRLSDGWNEGQNAQCYQQANTLGQYLNIKDSEGWRKYRLIVLRNSSILTEVS
jgi:hypothetical protein